MNATCSDRTGMAVQPLLDRITRDFTYHAANHEQATLYGEIRSKARELAKWLALHCSQSRELSLALTNLEQVVFWANASVAREGK